MSDENGRPVEERIAALEFAVLRLEKLVDDHAFAISTTARDVADIRSRHGLLEHAAPPVQVCADCKLSGFLHLAADGLFVCTTCLPKHSGMKPSAAGVGVVTDRAASSGESTTQTPGSEPLRAVYDKAFCSAFYRDLERFAAKKAQERAAHPKGEPMRTSGDNIPLWCEPCMRSVTRPHACGGAAEVVKCAQTVTSVPQPATGGLRDMWAGREDAKPCLCGRPGVEPHHCEPAAMLGEALELAKRIDSIILAIRERPMPRASSEAVVEARVALLGAQAALSCAKLAAEIGEPTCPCEGPKESSVTVSTGMAIDATARAWVAHMSCPPGGRISCPYCREGT